MRIEFLGSIRQVPASKHFKKVEFLMPLYDYKCLKCGKECLVALTLKEHERGEAVCPSCGSKELEQLITNFIARTGSKS